MDRFHDIYVNDHLVILSKCMLKFEVRREVGKMVCTQFVYPNFFKIILLLVFYETLCDLIDSLDLTAKFLELRYKNINFH